VEAARRFGDAARYRPTLERIDRRRRRRARVRELWDETRQDIRYAVRKIGREPAFFAFAALIMGLGVGATAAVYSVMGPLMLRPLPFQEPERLVWVANTGNAGLSGITSRTSNLRDYRALNGSFEALTGYFAFFEYGSYHLIGDGDPERLIGVGVAQDFLDVLGVRPAVGRNFVHEEGLWGGRPAAMLTHGFWVRRFGADPGIVGRTLTLNGQPTEVVGVLPATFDFAATFAPGSRIDLVTPFPISDETDQWGNTLFMIGRLRPGATVASAQADLDRINARLREADPARWGLGARVSGLHDQIAGRFRGAMLLLAGAALAVLLIGCANLSNLLLARGRQRGKELAVRSALGADRARLVRQLIVENLLLALGAGVIGTALAGTFVRSMAGMNAVRIPMLASASLDAGALTFTLAITLLAGLLAGVAPAVQAARGREAAALRELSRGSTSGRGSVTVRETLVVAEVALACCLLVAMGLLLRSFTKVMDVDLGFEAERTVMWQIEAQRPFENDEARATFFQNLVDRIAAIPGVDGAGLTDTPPLGRNRAWGVQVPGVVNEQGQAAFPRIVDSRYLEVMRIPLLAGRHFTLHDDADATRVVILNETAAATLFPDQDALGRTIALGNEEPQVVGIAGDVRHQSLEEASGLEIYLPMGQAGVGAFALIVRSERPLPAVVLAVRAALRDVDPTMPTGDYQTLGSVVDRAVSPRRFILLLVGSFAATALVLAALGIYAVLSYTVSQRTAEIGIRMALGESATEVRRRVVLRTLALAGIGIGSGALLSFALSRLMQSLLFGIAPADPLAFGGMALLLLLTAGAAAYLPARRASRTDPMGALRSV
jgi:predicted permease